MLYGFIAIAQACCMCDIHHALAPFTHLSKQYFGQSFTDLSDIVSLPCQLHSMHLACLCGQAACLTSVHL